MGTTEMRQKARSAISSWQVPSDSGHALRSGECESASALVMSGRDTTRSW